MLIVINCLAQFRQLLYCICTTERINNLKIVNRKVITRSRFGFSINIVLSMANYYRSLVIIYGWLLVDIHKHDYIRRKNMQVKVHSVELRFL